MAKIEIKIKAYEASLVDQGAKKIVEAAKDDGAKVSGPVPLPVKRDIFTILRATHVNKKSREQFEIRTHKRLIVINEASAKFLDSLKRMDIAAGIQIEVKTK